MEDDSVKGFHIQNMKVTLNGKTFAIECEESGTLRDIEAMLPVEFRMSRNGDVEFTGKLPAKPRNDGRKLSHTKPNEIYYYEGWNVLCLNYRVSDISPYTITYLGKVSDSEFSELLKKAEEPLNVTAEE